MLIGGFLETSFVDWRGKIVATIFTYGCNFRCPFCHNYTLVTKKMNNFLSVEEVIRKLEDIKDWIDGICITGGEPTVHEDLMDFIRDLSRIKPVKLDTNGSNPDMLREVIKYVDYVAMDIKAPKSLYDKLSGVKVNMDKIEESIELIKKDAKDYEFRTTAVPVLSSKEFREIADWLNSAKRFVIQQFSVDGGTLDLSFSHLSPYPSHYLERICNDIKHYFKDCVLVNL